MAKPTTTRVPWYEPARFVWHLPWLGLVFALNVVITVWALAFFGQLILEEPFTLTWIFGFLVGFALSYLIIAVAIAMIIATAVLLFGSLTRKATVSADKITDRDLVATEYQSLPRRRFFLNIILWGSTAAIMIFQFIPVFLGPLPLILSRYTIPAFHLLEVVYPNFDWLFVRTPNLSYFAIPVTVSWGAALALSFGMFIWLLMATLRPNNARLLKWIFLAFALSLAAVAPLGVFPYINWFELSNGMYLISSHMDVFDYLAPFYLLLGVSLVWLSFQRARLAALGARVKVWLRLIALGGVALQAFYLAFWSVFATQNANAGAEVFYVGSALIAAFAAVAWLGLFLMVGARRKWDWALFGLVAATQIASLIVVYPGLLAP